MARLTASLGGQELIAPSPDGVNVYAVDTSKIEHISRPGIQVDPSRLALGQALNGLNGIVQHIPQQCANIGFIDG